MKHFVNYWPFDIFGVYEVMKWVLPILLFVTVIILFSKFELNETGGIKKKFLIKLYMGIPIIIFGISFIQIFCNSIFQKYKLVWLTEHGLDHDVLGWGIISKIILYRTIPSVLLIGIILFWISKK